MKLNPCYGRPKDIPIIGTPLIKEGYITIK